MSAISHLPPIEDLWTPTGGLHFDMDDMPSELKLWRHWSNRPEDNTMDSSLKKRSVIRSSIAESNCNSCGIADFELRCRSCGTASVLFLDENELPILPAHACPSLEMTSSRPSTTSDSVHDGTSLFSTPSFGSVRNETPTPSEGMESAVSPRTAHHAVNETTEEEVEPTLIGLPPVTDDELMSPTTMANNSVPAWVSRSDCVVSAAMAAVFAQEQLRHERDFGLRSRSSISSATSRSIKRKAVRATPRWTPSEGAGSSSAAPSEYQGESPYQAPVESMVDAVATPEIQNVRIATPQIEMPVDMPAGSTAEPVVLTELVLSPTDSYFPTAADLTYASLAPLPPSPTASSVYSTDSYTEDEQYSTPNEETELAVGTAIPYKPYRSEPLPTPTLRSPASPASRSASITSKSPQPPTSAAVPEASEAAAPAGIAAAAGAVAGAGIAHLASQKQALAQPASATQKKWFERPAQATEMKFKFVLTPRNGAKAAGSGGKKAYVLPQADEDGRIIEPSAAKPTPAKKAAPAAAAAATEKKADEGSSGPIAASSSSSAGMPSSVSLAQLARDPNELQRLLACTMFLLNDVPDKDAAPKTLDLGVIAGRGAGPGGYAMKHHTATDYEKEGLTTGMRNVKWRVSMR